MKLNISLTPGLVLALTLLTSSQAQQLDPARALVPPFHGARCQPAGPLAGPENLPPAVPRESLRLPLPASTLQVDRTAGRLPLSFERNQGQVGAEAKFLARGSGYHLFLTPTEIVMMLLEPRRTRRREGADISPARIGVLAERFGPRPVPVAAGEDLEFYDGLFATELLRTGTVGDPLMPVPGLASAPARPLPPWADAFGAIDRRSSNLDRPGHVLRMRLVGSNPSPSIRGENELPGKVNYFIGTDPGRWRTNIATYARVRLEDVYPGIDLVYYGNQRELEYDFVVTPGADANAIKLAFERADRIEVDDAGELILTVSGRQVRWRRPKVYQELNGARHEIAAAYYLAGAAEDLAYGVLPEVSFQVADYDRTQPLVIDPVLVYSTFWGGSDSDVAGGIAVDSGGSAYIAGTTLSSDLPTTNAVQSSLRGVANAFMTKLSPTGDSILYSTYLGGSGDEFAGGLAVDPAGSAYLVGDTSSPDFPLVNAVQAVRAGGRNVFAAKLSPDGMAVLFSTYLGGSGTDYGGGIALDGATNVYLTGFAFSTNFPTVNAYQGEYGSGTGSHAFVAKLDSIAPRIVYSTYLGGSRYEGGEGIAVDFAGHAYVVGFTASTNFPTKSAAQAVSGGGADAFVTKLAVSGSELEYSTYLGGSGLDVLHGIALDPNGAAFVTGRTDSRNLPTAPQSLQSSFAGGSLDGFVAKLSPAGSAFEYVTYLGGEDYDEGENLGIDGDGNAYVVGITSSTNFPTANPIQSENRSRSGQNNAFISKLSSDGGALLWSTYFGGGSDDGGTGIALDSARSVYFTGRTSSSDFPVHNALQPMLDGPQQDVFVVKLAQLLPPLMQITRSGNTVLVTWQKTGTAIGFEVSDTITPAPNWSLATNTPVVVGDQNVVTIEALSGTRFFRLKTAQ